MAGACALAAVLTADLSTVGTGPGAAEPGRAAQAGPSGSASAAAGIGDARRFSIQVAACDLRSTGVAQVTYTVANLDVAEHGYRVEVTVVNANGPVGSNVSIVSHVAPGDTATARTMIPLTADPSGAQCAAVATPRDSHGRH